MSVDISPDPFDTSRPSVARAYDYVLGGKDNFEADRQFADAIAEHDPNLQPAAVLNKDFARRVTSYLAQRGIRQFLDLGSGIPTSPPAIHDVARAVVPDARVVYVDHDPVVVRHNEALQATGPGLAVIPESFASMDSIFDTERFAATIDTGEPIAVSFYSVLQNTPDEAAAALLADLRQRLAPGSFLAISHICDRTEQHIQNEFHVQSEQKGYPWIFFRTADEVAALCTGFDLIDPGVVDYRDWRPDHALADHRPDLSTHLYGAVAQLSP